ncbi:hypothetical protein [Salegentibacter sp.]|uniref:hypothetical protein n=1 Tax=Salegentibacter sp. TaxID=1903072 RepID=UPI0035671F30
MALHNFEEQAEEKLRERQIAPSAESWKKLESRMGRDDKKQNFRIWLPVVAALVVLAFLAGNLFIKTTQESPAIVEEPIEKVPEKEDFKTPVEIASEESGSKPTQTENAVSAEQIPPQPTPEIKREELVAASTEIESFHFILDNMRLTPQVQEGIIMETELEEAIAMVVNEQAERDLTDAEVDDLLLNAASKITQRQTFGNYESVNASTLLADVETELDQSFRQKVFELLKEGFEEASYAFTNRNN